MALDLSFTSLADIAQSGGGGQPVEIPLDEIIEDPAQPRTNFDEAELQQLAASIARLGVIQAISVRPKNVDGKHVILFGARRYRASRLAGRDRIRAVIESAETPDAYLQLVENIQRADLKPLEVAAFVTGRLQAGDRASSIAERLGKPKDWVSRYAAVAKMPAFLQDKLATSPIRAVYELFQAWREQPDAVERLAKAQDAFTDAQARQVARDLRQSGRVDVDPVAQAMERPGAETLGVRKAGEGRASPGSTTSARERASPRSGAASDEARSEKLRSLTNAVDALERKVRADGTPVASRLLGHYETLSQRLEQESADAHDVLVSRKAALRLIRLVVDGD